MSRIPPNSNQVVFLQQLPNSSLQNQFSRAKQLSKNIRNAKISDIELQQKISYTREYLIRQLEDEIKRQAIESHFRVPAQPKPLNIISQAPTKIQANHHFTATSNLNNINHGVRRQRTFSLQDQSLLHQKKNTENVNIPIHKKSHPFVHSAINNPEQYAFESKQDSLINQLKVELDKKERQLAQEKTQRQKISYIYIELKNQNEKYKLQAAKHESSYKNLKISSMQSSNMLEEELKVGSLERQEWLRRIQQQEHRNSQLAKAIQQLNNRLQFIQNKNQTTFNAQKMKDLKNKLKGRRGQPDSIQQFGIRQQYSSHNFKADQQWFITLTKDFQEYKRIMKTEIEEVTQKLQIQTSSTKKLVAENQNLQQEHNEYRCFKQKLELQNSRKKKQMEQLEDNYREHLKEQYAMNTSFVNKIQEYDNTILELSSKINEKDQYISQMQSENHNLQTQIQNLISQSNDAKKLGIQLEKQNKNLLNKLNIISAQFQTAQKEYNVIKQDLSNYHRQEKKVMEIYQKQILQKDEIINQKNRQLERMEDEPEAISKIQYDKISESLQSKNRIIEQLNVSMKNQQNSWQIKMKKIQQNFELKMREQAESKNKFIERNNILQKQISIMASNNKILLDKNKELQIETDKLSKVNQQISEQLNKFVDGVSQQKKEIMDEMSNIHNILRNKIQQSERTQRQITKQLESQKQKKNKLKSFLKQQSQVIDETVKQRNQLCLQIEEIRVVLTEKLNQIHSLKENNTYLDSRIAGLERQKQNAKELQTSIGDKTKQLNLLETLEIERKQKQLYVQQINESRENETNLLTALQKAESYIRQIQSKLNLSNGDLKKLEDQLRKIKQMNVKNQERQQKEYIQLKEQENQLIQQKNAYQAMINHEIFQKNAIQQQLGLIINQLQSKQKEYEKEIYQLNHDIRQFQENIKQQQITMGLLQSQISKHVAQLDAIRSQSNEQIMNMQAEIHHLNCERTSLFDQKNALINQIEQRQIIIQQIKAEAEQLSQKSQNIAQLQKMMAYCQETASSEMAKRKNIEQSLRVRIEDSKRMEAKYFQQTQKRQDHIKELQQKNQRLATEINHLKTEVSVYTVELNNSNKQSNEKISNLGAEISRLGIQAVSLYSQIQRLQHLNSQKQAIIMQIRNQSSQNSLSSSSQVLHLTHKNIELSNQLQFLQNSSDSLKKQNQEYYGVITSLEKNNQQLLGKIEQIINLKVENAQILEKTKIQYNQEINILKEKVSNFEKQSNRKDQGLLQLAAQLKHSRQCNWEIESQKNHLIHKINQLSQANQNANLEKLKSIDQINYLRHRQQSTRLLSEQTATKIIQLQQRQNKLNIRVQELEHKIKQFNAEQVLKHIEGLQKQVNLIPIKVESAIIGEKQTIFYNMVGDYPHLKNQINLQQFKQTNYLSYHVQNEQTLRLQNHESQYIKKIMDQQQSQKKKVEEQREIMQYDLQIARQKIKQLQDKLILKEEFPISPLKKRGKPSIKESNKVSDIQKKLLKENQRLQETIANLREQNERIKRKSSKGSFSQNGLIQQRYEQVLVELIETESIIQLLQKQISAYKKPGHKEIVTSYKKRERNTNILKFLEFFCRKKDSSEKQIPGVSQIIQNSEQFMQKLCELLAHIMIEQENEKLLQSIKFILNLIKKREQFFMQKLFESDKFIAEHNAIMKKMFERSSSDSSEDYREYFTKEQTRLIQERQSFKKY